MKIPAINTNVVTGALMWFVTSMVQAAYVEFAQDELFWSGTNQVTGINSEIIASDHTSWANVTTSLAYTVSFDAEANNGEGLWKYDYTWSVSRKSISHFILSLTDGEDPFSDDNLFGLAGGGFDGIKDYGPHPSNPGLENIGNDFSFYGLKVDTPDESLINTITIETDRGPMLGGAYMKSGVDNGNKVWAYTSGLGTPMEINLADLNPDGTFKHYIDGYILAPDSFEGAIPPSAIPLPATVWLFGSGLLGLIGAARRKKC